MSEMIMERLRNETKAAHQQLEKATVPYIRKAVDNEQYAFLLKMFYGYFRPVEEQIQAYIDNTILEDISERRQTAALLADLQYLGADTTDLSRSGYLPAITSVPQALGALYVLEGSTLGGRFISQMLMKQLNRSAAEGIAFFSGYGADTDAKWKAFTEAVNKYAEKFPERQDEIVAAAGETFTAFGRWVAHYEEKATPPVGKMAF